ncbi:hypothetical protein ABIF61_006108 [Bradyrhizobium japonicum]
MNAEIGIGHGQAAHLHGERRRGHHQIHHGIGDDAAQRRRDEARLRHDREQRPAAMQIGRRGLGHVDAGDDAHRDQRHGGLHQEAEGEQIGLPDVHGPLHELRTEHAGEHAAGHHPGHRLGPVGRAGAIGSGEAIGLRDGAVEAAEEGCDAEQRERAVQDRERAEHAGKRAEARADDEGHAAAETARDRAGRQRAGSKSDHIHRDRHGCERHVRRERGPDNRARGEDHGRVGARQRLGRGQAHHIGAHAGVVGDLMGRSHVKHRLFLPEWARGLVDSRHYGGTRVAGQPAQTGAGHASDAIGAMIAGRALDGLRSIKSYRRDFWEFRS